MHAGQRMMFIMVSILITMLASDMSFSAGIPDQVTIDPLQQYYSPVLFNHAMHISNLKDCGLCHHHTTGAQVTDPNCVRCHKNSGAQPVVSCKGCHLANPFSPTALKQQRDQQPPLYHRDKPGLKAAYHLSCLGCHKKMGGPVGCQDCHKLTSRGEALYKTGVYTPKAPARHAPEH